MSIDIDLRDAAISGKPFSEIDGGVLHGLVHNKAWSSIRGVISTYRGVVITGRPTSELSIAIRGKSMEEKLSIVRGVVISERHVLLSGLPTGEMASILLAKKSVVDSITSLLRGVITSEISGLTKASPYSDFKSILQSVSWANRHIVLIGKPFSEESNLIKGKPYSDWSAITSGYLLIKDLVLNYNINKLALTITQIPNNLAVTESVQVYLSSYEEGIKPLYIYWNSGRVAYEYLPDSQTISPVQTDLPDIGDFELVVYGQGINNFKEKQTIIKEINNIDFDGLIRKAFEETIGEKSYTLTLHYGIKGTYSRIWCIMRVRTTSDRHAWLIGKPYPVLLVGTDFGLYVLRTTSRWHYRWSIMSGVLWGFERQFKYRWALIRGALVDDKSASLFGKYYNDIYTIVSGKPCMSVYVRMRGVVLNNLYAISFGKPYSDQKGIIKPKPQMDRKVILWGYRGAIAYLYSTIFGRPYRDIKAVLFGKSCAGIYIRMRGVIFNVRLALTYGKPMSLLYSTVWGKPTSEFFIRMRGVIFNSYYSVLLGRYFSDAGALVRAKYYSNISARIWGYKFIYNSLLAISSGKPMGHLFGLIRGTPCSEYRFIFRGVIWYRMSSLISGKPYSEIYNLVVGKTKLDISSIVRGMIWVLQSAVIWGKIYSNLYSLISGKSMFEIGSVFRGMSWLLRYAVLKGKPYLDVSGLAKGKSMSEVYEIIRGVVVNEQYGVGRGKTFEDVYSLVHGKIFYDLGGVIRSGFAFSIPWAILRGKPSSNFFGIMQAATWNIDGWATIRGYLYRDDNDQASITNGRDDWEVWVGNSYCGLDYYNSSYNGRWISKIIIGTTTGYIVLAHGSIWSSSGIMPALERGVIYNYTKSVLFGKYFSDVKSLLAGFIYTCDNQYSVVLGVGWDNVFTIVRGVKFSSSNSTLRGVTTSNYLAILQPVIADLKNSILWGKRLAFHNSDSILRGVVFNEVAAIVYSQFVNSIYDLRLGIIEGLPMSNVCGILLGRSWITSTFNLVLATIQGKFQAAQYLIKEQGLVPYSRGVRSTTADAIARLWSVYGSTTTSGFELACSVDYGKTWSVKAVYEPSLPDPLVRTDDYSLAVDGNRNIHIVWSETEIIPDIELMDRDFSNKDNRTLYQYSCKDDYDIRGGAVYLYNIRASLGNSLGITGDLTIEFWFKFTRRGVIIPIISKARGGPFSVFIDTNDRLYFCWGTSGTDSSPYQACYSGILTVGCWYHVVIIRDLVNMKITFWINGEKDREYVAVYTSATVGSQTTYIGYRSSGGYWAVGLVLDELRVYNRVLTNEEVLQRYNNGLGWYGTTPDAGLQCGFHMDEYSGADCIDYTGNLSTVWKNTGGVDTSPSRVHGRVYRCFVTQADMVNYKSGNSSLKILMDQTTSLNKNFEVVLSSKCLNLCGGSTYGMFSDAAEYRLNRDLTIMVWFKPSTSNFLSANLRNLISKHSRSEFLFGIITSGRNLYFEHGAGSTYYGHTLPSNYIDMMLDQWMHATVVRCISASTPYLDWYINGKFVYRHILTFANPATSTTNLCIGYYSSSWTYFLGWMDELRVYAKALDAETISWHYNNGRGRYIYRGEEGLVLVCHFDEGSGTTILNRADPAYSSGTYYSAAWTNPTDGPFAPLDLSGKTHLCTWVMSTRSGTNNKFRITNNYGTSINDLAITIYKPNVWEYKVFDLSSIPIDQRNVVTSFSFYHTNADETETFWIDNCMIGKTVYTVKYCVYNDELGTLSSPEYISISGVDWDNRYPCIAVDKYQNVIIAWCNASGCGYGYNISVKKYFCSANEWSEEEKVTLIGGQFYPSMSMDSNNNIHLSWFGRGYYPNPDKYSVVYAVRSGTG